jgi:hypothetical protein
MLLVTHDVNKLKAAALGQLSNTILHFLLLSLFIIATIIIIVVYYYCFQLLVTPSFSTYST